MESSEKRTVTVNFDGRWAVTLRLEVNPALRDDTLYLHLGRCLASAIQSQELASDGITWEEADLRAVRERLRSVILAMASHAPATRRPSRRQGATDTHPPAVSRPGLLLAGVAAAT